MFLVSYDVLMSNLNKQNKEMIKWNSFFIKNGTDDLWRTLNFIWRPFKWIKAHIGLQQIVRSVPSNDVFILV